MAADSDEGTVGIKMVDLESKRNQLEEEETEQPSYKDTFKTILTDHYDDDETWWDAVEDLLKKGGEFAEKVSRSQSAFLLHGAAH